MATRNSNVTQERLKELLHYDPDTGFFTWKVARGPVRKQKTPKCLSHGYVVIGIDGLRYFAHRLAWFYVHGIWPPCGVDHVNAVRSDNRLTNLRLATQAENMQNVKHHARPNSATGLLGIMRNGNRWAAQIRANKKRIYIGTYDTQELAHEAYMKAKQALHPFAPKDAHVEEIP